MWIGQPSCLHQVHETWIVHWMKESDKGEHQREPGIGHGWYVYINGSWWVIFLPPMLAEEVMFLVPFLSTCLDLWELCCTSLTCIVHHRTALCTMVYKGDLCLWELCCSRSEVMGSRSEGQCLSKVWLLLVTVRGCASMLGHFPYSIFALKQLKPLAILQLSRQQYAVW